MELEWPVADRSRRQARACQRATTAKEADLQFRQRLLVQTPQFARACKSVDTSRTNCISHAAFRLLLARSFQIEPNDAEFAKMMALPEYLPASGLVGVVCYVDLMRRFGDNADSPSCSLPIYGSGGKPATPIAVSPVSLGRVSRSGSRASTRGSVRGSRSSSLALSARMSLGSSGGLEGGRGGMPQLNIAAMSESDLARVMSPQARAALTARSRATSRLK